MAKVKKKHRKPIKKQVESPFKNYWQKTNYTLLGAGLGVLILGFFLMSFGPWDNPISLTLSPLVLLIAYLVIFPLSILYKKKNNKSENNTDAASES